jgi:hypothetical protein
MDNPETMATRGNPETMVTPGNPETMATPGNPETMSTPGNPEFYLLLLTVCIYGNLIRHYIDAYYVLTVGNILWHTVNFE